MAVYFVRRKDDSRGLIKIGFTRKIESRLEQLNAEFPEGVELLATCEGGSALENTIHRHLAEYRVEGEWFQPSSAVLDAIGAAKSKGIADPNDPLTRDRILPEDETSSDIRVETRFYLNELMRREWRGYGDSLEGARDRVLDRLGIDRSQGKRLFHRLRGIKTISGDVYRLLSIAYCEAVHSEGRAEDRHIRLLSAVHNINEGMRRRGELPADEGYFAPWEVASAGADLPGVSASNRAGAAAW